jgi:hypothetical protein
MPVLGIRWIAIGSEENETSIRETERYDDMKYWEQTYRQKSTSEQRLRLRWG